MNNPLEHIFANLRQRDLDELVEFGHTPEYACAMFTHSHPAFFQLWASKRTMKPACFISFHALTPVALAVGFFATDDWPHVAGQVFRTGVRHIKPELLRHGFRRAECRVMEGHDDAIRMLEHFGFRQETRLAKYGATGKAFLQYAWVADAHAHDDAAVREQRLHQRKGPGPGTDDASKGMGRAIGLGIAVPKTSLH